MENEHHRLFLELAVEKAEDKYGDIRLIATEAMSQEQAFSAMKANSKEIDLAIGGLSSDRERDFLPVYVPIDRGLLGFRICIIDPVAQSQFNLIQKPDDFKTLGLEVGIGEFWPDAFVLEFNGIPLKTAPNSEDLIKLLREQKIACFSRGLNELTEELSKLEGLVPEQRIMLIYPMADMIYSRVGAFVKHEIIDYGLANAIEDGSFNELFSEYYGGAIEIFSIYQRKLMFLDNPDLSEKGREAINQHGIASFTGIMK